MRTAEAVLCGAGIAGVSAAYHLTVRHGLRDVVLVDDQPPLSVTSDKSTECYRNWWPGPGDTMIRFMNRGIDLLEELAAESVDRFVMNRRGPAERWGDDLHPLLRQRRRPALPRGGADERGRAPPVQRVARQDHVRGLPGADPAGPAADDLDRSRDPRLER